MTVLLSHDFTDDFIQKLGLSSFSDLEMQHPSEIMKEFADRFYLTAKGNETKNAVTNGMYQL